MSCPPGRQPQARKPARDRPDYGHAAAGQIRGPAHADRDDHRDQRPRDPAGDLARRKHDQDDPGRHRHVCPFYVRERAHRVQEPGRGLFARRGYPEHVRELAGSHLDTDAGKEPDQHGAGKEIRQEP